MHLIMNLLTMLEDPTADPSSGLHGYTHEHVDMLTEEQEREVLAKSIEAVTKFTGVHPKGWTAPSWRTSSRSIKLLEEFGLVSVVKSTVPIVSKHI